MVQGDLNGDSAADQDDQHSHRDVNVQASGEVTQHSAQDELNDEQSDQQNRASPLLRVGAGRRAAGTLPGGLRDHCQPVGATYCHGIASCSGVCGTQPRDHGVNGMWQQYGSTTSVAKYQCAASQRCVVWTNEVDRRGEAA